MSEKRFYILEQGIPVTSPIQWLARIVSNYRRPHLAFTPRHAPPPSFQYHSDPEFSNVTRVFHELSTSSVQLSLLDVLGISHEGFISRAQAFQSRKVQRLRIEQDATVLEKVLSDRGVNSDLKEWSHDVFRPMFFIVGLLVTDEIAQVSLPADTKDESRKADLDRSEDPSQPSSDAATHARGQRIFAIEYRSFWKRLQQRPNQKARLGGFGTQGDRMFGETDEAEDEIDVLTEPDPEPFLDIVIEVDGDEERCVTLSGSSPDAVDDATAL